MEEAAPPSEPTRGAGSTEHASDTSQTTQHLDATAPPPTPKPHNATTHHSTPHNAINTNTTTTTTLQCHQCASVAEEMMLHLGGSVGYWQGDTLKLVDDIGALKPTLFIGVPRIFDRIYAGVTGQIDKAGEICS